MASLFRKDIKFLKGIGEKRALLFHKVGVNSVGDLICFYPRTYEDWSNPYQVSNVPINECCCVEGIVANDVLEVRIRKNMVLYKFKICDSIDLIEVTLFNVPYIKKQIRKGDSILLRGIVKIKYGRKEISSPVISRPDKNIKINPIYSQTAGLYNSQIIDAVRQALLLLPEKINDTIPQQIREEYNLCDLKFALWNIHFPEDLLSLEKAKHRIAFEDILILQLGMNLYKYQNCEEPKNKIRHNFTDEFTSILPFSLTKAQVRVIDECMQDMMSSKRELPMARLVQGDVGSGKTAVCAALSYNVVKSGGQVALMAPTEILAHQHYKFFSKLFESTDFFIKLLTGSTPLSEKSNVTNLCSSGKVDILIGTHALLSDNLEFKNLSLVITDEQHRFGVAQRAKLNSKGETPHMLVMSATPIPRTLSLIIYGDLDISIIDEFPAGRQSIKTFCIPSDSRNEVIDFIDNLINQGQQGYIVCPLVEQGDGTLVSVESYYESIRLTHLNKYRISILHGQMKSKEKDLIMKNFLAGEIDILISTTVIEVGIDVPNATFMVIENAERFGLAQLHQLRGRVGRGTKKSYCILVSEAQNEEAQKRLSIMTETNDGFKIADEDLKLRGPGDFLGSRQHGMPDFKSINVEYSYKLIKEAKSAAEKILNEDPNLSLPKNKLIRSKIKIMFGEIKSYLN